jgi:hypothetical protein
MADRSIDRTGIETEIAHLRGLDLDGLRARWHSATGRRPPPHLPRHLLFRILAYRLQADAFGDLDRGTECLLGRAGAAPEDASGRTTDAPQRRDRTLRPGTILAREWNGALERVTVLDVGFAWNGTTYHSLSGVAFAITGTRWNGPRFFGLRGAAASS